MLIVLDQNECMTIGNMYQLGLVTKEQFREAIRKTEAEEEPDPVSFDFSKVCEQEFLLIVNSDLYKKNANGTFFRIGEEEKDIEEALKRALPLKITGLIKASKDADIDNIDSTVVYTSKLTNYMIEHGQTSEVIQAQQKTPEINVLSGSRFATGEPTDQENLAGGHSESAIPTTHMDFSDEEDYGEPNLLNLDESEEPKAEESATNVDDAFSSLLGDDELPEEKSEKPAETAEEEVSLEEPVAEQPAEETVEEAVEETAAPVEEPAAEPSLEETASESESAELTLDEPAAEESTADESTEKTLEESVEDSFGSLFEKSADAEFSLNDEPSADESSESVLEKAPEFTPTESAENITLSVRPTSWCISHSYAIRPNRVSLLSSPRPIICRQ